MAVYIPFRPRTRSFAGICEGAPKKTADPRAIAGRYSAVMSQDDESAFRVFRVAEELVSEGSYGGAWIDRTLASPVLGLALVDPEAVQVSSIREVAKRAGCRSRSTLSSTAVPS
jgi:hypothetical protein